MDKNEIAVLIRLTSALTQLQNAVGATLDAEFDVTIAAGQLVAVRNLELADDCANLRNRIQALRKSLAEIHADATGVRESLVGGKLRAPRRQEPQPLGPALSDEYADLNAIPRVPR